MFRDSKLEEHLKKEATLNIESFIVAEWNLNDSENILDYGNYRYRPTTNNSPYINIPDSYDYLDSGNFYTGSLESTTFSQFLLDSDDPSLAYVSVEKDRELYFSLKDCFEPFRPRSGINKVLYFNQKYIDNIRSARRPRYYMSSRYDEFKYWTSYRKENNKEFGISSGLQQNNIGYRIDDASPFIIYKKEIPTNRIVLKMQTNLAETPREAIRINQGTIADPLGDRGRSSIPKRWSVQYLDENDNWNTAISFNEDSLRRNENPIVDWDGYLELYYGIKIPEEYKEQFNFVDYLSASAQLPVAGLNGESYIVGASNTEIGELYIWNNSNFDWDRFVPEYGFSLLEDDDTKRIGLLKKLTDPDYFVLDGVTTFRDIVFIKGMRVIVETMFGPNTTLDLIEMSPRLKANISDYVLDFEIVKSIANDGTGIPVGNLLASNGTVSLMNYDSAFSQENKLVNNLGSLVADYLKPNVKFDFYEAILDVEGFDKFIPLKTFYAESFPIASGGIEEVEVTLRDFFFKLETTKAPTILLTNVTLTGAVSILLDSIGFSNYVFNTTDFTNDPIIPYFFIEPDASVAEVLERLAVSTQAAMFFDEFNNFSIMFKEYLLPSEDVRPPTWELLGQVEEEKLPNILSLNNTESKILNAGNINYTIRYIQRSAASLKQASYIDEDRTYIYKPVLLWEVASGIAEKTINEKAKNAQGFALGAAALNTSLTDRVPTVSARKIINNIIDLGENVYWLPRFQGYLFANGEIIRYDAVEYAISGSQKEFISSNQEYQKYFSSLPFNGKMYPTGNVRIYTEPLYETIKDGSGNDVVVFKNGIVKSHGRGQFGTEITSHSAGLPSYWSSNDNVRGITMASEYIFSTTPTEDISYPDLIQNPTPAPLVANLPIILKPPPVVKVVSGSIIQRPPIFVTPIVPPSTTAPAVPPLTNRDYSIAKLSSRTGIVSNFMRETIPSDSEIKNKKTTSSGTVQSSALVFYGPNPMPTGTSPRDFTTSVYKLLNSDYKHFGTRIRIIGQKGSETGTQNPINAVEYFKTTSSLDRDVILSGGSGGIGIGVDQSTGYGYYFEIMSLTNDNVSQFSVFNETKNKVSSIVHNIVFYKVVPQKIGSNLQPAKIPYKLWGGIGQILVDDGRFVGQDRLVNQNNPTVYDLAVEYETIGSVRRFYLYINNVLIATVDDKNPIRLTAANNSLALFVRGSTKCMFENVYALKELYSKETSNTVINSNTSIFEDSEITAYEALRKYSIPGFINTKYLTGISSTTNPKVDMYFEEFGTILRECSYFNIKYDQAYPALLALIAPTISKEKSYTVSGFRAGSYGAEFLIFNNTDKSIVLDETTGNYLRIVGVTFTQNTSEVLSVDDFFQKRSNFSDPIISDQTIFSPQIAEKTFQNIKLSRSKYGKKEFTIDSPYVQSEDQANDLMNWLVDKTLKQRKIIEVDVFGVPHLQLGDIVTINYKLPDGYLFEDTDKKFVVSAIGYNKNQSGPTNNLRLVEV